MSKLFEAMERKTTKEVQSRVKLAYAWGGKAGLVDAKEKFRTTLTLVAFGEFAGALYRRAACGKFQRHCPSGKDAQLFFPGGFSKNCIYLSTCEG